MGAAIGGRHTVMVATTILTRRRTVARITGVMVIIIQRLTMTLPREPMGGNRPLMGLMDRRPEEPVTILTPELMPEALQSRHLTVAEVPRRPTIRTLEHMLRPDKARARTLSGAARTCREATRALPWAITQPPTEP